MASPAEIELLKLMSGGSKAREKLSRAQALMGTEAPQPLQAGKWFVASNPGASMANALMRIGGGVATGLADREVEAADQKMAGGLQGVVDRERAAAQAAAEQERQRYADEQAFKQSQFGLQQQQAGESARHNRALEGQGAWSIDDKAGLMIDARTGRTRPVDIPLDPATGRPRGSVGAQPRLQQSDKESLEGLAGELGNINRLRSAFKDEYAGGGPLASVGVSMAQKAGSMAPEESQKKAAWWSDFQMLVEMPQRNKLFGASLTPGEAESWKAAQNINPGKHPELARKKMEEMAGIVERKMANRRDALIAEGYNQQAIDALTRVSAGAPAAPVQAAAQAPAPNVREVGGKRYVLENGKWYEEG